MSERTIHEARRPRRVLVTILAGLLLVASTAAGGAQAAPPSDDPCDDAVPTLSGTSGDDILEGTPGDDVILALAGDDIVRGQGGDDLLCGGNGNDVLFGGLGNDTLVGDNGNDLLVGEGGDDVLLGGNGTDRLFGTAGADAADGGNGGDLIGGGTGDDTGDGGNGPDQIVGGSGADGASGGKGPDVCTSEVTNGCERSNPDAALAVSAGPVSAERQEDGSLTVEVSAGADAGLAMVLLVVNDELAFVERLDPAHPQTNTHTITLEEDVLPNGSSQLVAVAIDALGNDASSEATYVLTDRDLGPEGPTVAVELTRPTPLSELAELLLVIDAELVELRHVREVDAPLDVPATVVDQAAAAGVEVLPAGTTLVGGFSGRGLAIVDQLALYSALSPDGDPLVTALRLSAPLNEQQRRLLQGIAVTLTDLPAREGYETSDSGEDSQSNSTATQRRQATPSKPDVPATDLQTAPRASRAAAAQAVEVDDRVFWPTFGQLDTTEFEVEVDRPFWFDSTYRRVQFDHDLVFSPGVPDNFAALDRAYEHDLKIPTEANTVGLRPACAFVNPLTSSDDAFYAHRGDGIYWDSNVPDGASPYFDTDVSDGCGLEDLSVGIRKPEVLDDGLDVEQSIAYHFTVVSARGNPDTGDFALSSQQLTRRGDLICGIVGSQNCTGLNADAGRGGFIARTAGELLPGITLPNCFTWNWVPDGRLLNNEIGARCSGDSDGDGWDDTVDCAPFDPAINPGAVDIPNDGIDQNCDGSDLVVGQGTLQFTLIWDNDNDQDLYVTEPGGDLIWYGSPGPTTSGGRLDRDDNVNVCGGDPEPGGVENIFWPPEDPAPTGTYTVTVNQFSSCGSPADWILEIRDGGALVGRTSGTASGSVTYTR